MRCRTLLVALLLAMGSRGPARAQLKPPAFKPPEARPPAGKSGEAEDSSREGSGLPSDLAALLETPEGLRIKEKEEDAPPTIQELTNPEVRTASQGAERARSAPAWILTFSAEELQARGYQELTDLLDDLPGMDTVHAWGDTYFESYWRGYLDNAGEPFLLLVDGLEFNHLSLGTAQILAALPLSNVERVEVVYGPASVLYGPNAAMGVINIITRQKEPTTGLRSQVSVHSPQGSLAQGQVADMTKVADVSASYVGQGFRVQLTGRFDVGVLDPALSERFEWLKNQYFTNTRLWGDFTKYSLLAGTFRSPNEKQAVDARLVLEHRDENGELRGETEVAAQFYRLLTGSGLIYPADVFQSRAPWVVSEQSLSLRHQQRLSSTLDSTTRLRYRRSGTDSPTAVLTRDRDDQTVSFFYVENASSSFTVEQNFRFNAGSELALPGDDLKVNFGLKYERRSLNDEFNSSSGEAWDPAVPLKDYKFPSPVSPGALLQGQSDLDLAGVYLQPRYTFLENHSLLLGLRLDYNALFTHLEPTFRGGYVGQLLHKALTLKAFYGQAIVEPSRKDSQKGAEQKELAKEPGRSGTLDVGLDYTLGQLAFHGTAYYVHAQDTDSTTGMIHRRLAGADLGATATLQFEGIRQLRLWGFYSTYLLAEQTVAPAQPEVLGPVPNVSRHKLLLGATLEVNRFLGLTALGRCFSSRSTESTNPLGTLPGYCVVDANLRVQHLIMDGLSLSLRVTNLLDMLYSQPGLGRADSGNTPGRWEGGTWIGSQGDYNSYMPQPGRAFSLQLGLNL